MLRELLHKIAQRYASKWLILMIEIGIVVITLFMAYFIRFNFQFDFDVLVVLKKVPIVVIAAVMSFLLMKMHRGVIRYTGFRDIINIVIATNILATILLLVSILGRKYDLGPALNLSGTIIYIHLFLNILFISGFRLFIKSLYRSIVSDFNITERVLIYGAGQLKLAETDSF